MKKNKLLTIGITGMMGSGKSTALNFFNKRGIKTYDLDIEAKKLLKKNSYCYNKILKYFGKKILNSNGSINKKKLRVIVFNNKKHLDILNSIVHPELNKKIILICNNLKKAKKKLVVFEGALISRDTKFGSSLDYILYIQAPNKILNTRIVKRDKIDKKNAEKLILMQKKVKNNKKNADFIIRNDSNIKEFNSRLNFVLDKLPY